MLLLWWCLSLSHVGSTSTLNKIGRNVCQRQEIYQTTIEVWENYERSYKTTKWCMSIPPRCDFYECCVTDQRKVPKVVNQTREISECCEGYVPNGRDCKASCLQPCRHGTCSKPNSCSCFPGFRGPQCHDICPRGKWGSQCSQNCFCENGAYCNPMNGVCVCSPGWKGPRCNEECEIGFFGYECRRPCYCQGTNLCHHITGECAISTTTQEEVESTTEEEEPTTTTLPPASSTIPSGTSTPEVPTTTTETISTSLPTTTTIAETSDFSIRPELSTELPTQTSTTDLPTKSTSIKILALDRESSVESSIATENSILSTTEMYSNLTRHAKNKEVPVWHESKEANEDVAKLVITITFSVLAAIAALIALAGVAISRHRKHRTMITDPPQKNPPTLYRFYAEENTPAKVVFHNPTYGCSETTLSHQPQFGTFKRDDDLFQTQLRGMLNQGASDVFEHLYDEINSATAHSSRDQSAYS